MTTPYTTNALALLSAEDPLHHIRTMPQRPPPSQRFAKDSKAHTHPVLEGGKASQPLHHTDGIGISSLHAWWCDPILPSLAVTTSGTQKCLNNATAQTLEACTLFFLFNLGRPYCSQSKHIHMQQSLLDGHQVKFKNLLYAGVHVRVASASSAEDFIPGKRHVSSLNCFPFGDMCHCALL